MSNRKKIVAIIDDDAGMRESAATLLLAFGYETETFDSAAAFLSAAATSGAACLVVDIHLGDITGLELARQLAVDGCTFPIIFMTGLESESIRDQAAAAGGVAFLGKPFPAEMLLDAVKKAIR
jgi:FixJ family two-component response regulator